jgi:hypothetical protein
MTEKLTDEKIEEGLRLAEKATPEPWDNKTYYMRSGVNDSSHKNWRPPKDIPKDRCNHCKDAAEPCKVTENVDGKGNFHRHEFHPGAEFFDDMVWWHDIVSTSTGEEITGNYDYEDGGVKSKEEDSDFICAARTLLPLALSELKEARQVLGEVLSDLRFIERTIPKSNFQASILRIEEMLGGHAVKVEEKK